MLTPKTNRFIASAIWALLWASTSASAAPPDFGAKIRPILSDKCFRCHGPDANARQGDLRLDQFETAKEVLASGKPNESELVSRIFSTDPDLVMPPPDAKLELSDSEKTLLKEWVASGAKYSKHWSFESIRRPALPDVKSKDWVLSPVDTFILQRLEAAGLKGASQADREALIRRVAFDLTGLPPTEAEISAFLNDSKPGAYARVVDRLLQSPEFGQRLASPWLDAARYSDSYGYQVDRDRFVWPWRDWVIRAINSNMPFDRFAKMQLAGDLIPNAGDDGLLATTFGRLHPQKVEGGSVPEEFRVEYVADRNHTVGTTFLGLTMECARCHDHKYDPISQKEYYQLFAFFNNIDEAGLYSYFTSSIPTPTLIMTTAKQKQEVAKLDAAVVSQETKRSKLRNDRKAGFEEWLKNRPKEVALPNLDKSESFEQVSGPHASVEGVKGKAIQLTGDDGFGIGVGNFRRFQPFSVSFWIKTPDLKERAVVFHRSRAWTDAASRGYELLLEDGKLSAALIHFYPGNAIRVRTTDPIAINKWYHVVISYDGSSRAKGLNIHLNGSPAKTTMVRDNLYKQIAGGGGDTITIGQRFRDRGFTKGQVDEFKVFSRELTSLEVAELHDGNSLGELLKRPLEQLTSADRAGLFDFYLSTSDAEYKKVLTELSNARKKRADFTESIREIMVMREFKPRRQTYVLKRGAYDAPSTPVAPQVPSAFPPLPKGSNADRLGFANWLTSKQHPLTARVAVNRYWQMLLGEGIVRTPEDFGTQGAPPTHPQLLDWLAAEFMDSGWDVKQLLRSIVLSSTYRQTSTVDQNRYNKDPENRLFSRSARYRLSAEMIRDNVLHASGLLVNQIGGTPAKPYDLTESFKPMGAGKGADLFRRSIFTYWKRTAPAPAMMALDAAKREVCMVKRERTSSPLQALVMLNGPQFIEAARVLAESLYAEQDGRVKDIIRVGFRRLTSRTPNNEEVSILAKLYMEELTYFQANKPQAKQLATVGKASVQTAAGKEPVIAALTVLMNTVMNYDECVVKR